jgi:hypothetical protein
MKNTYQIDRLDENGNIDAAYKMICTPPPSQLRVMLQALNVGRLGEIRQGGEPISWAQLVLLRQRFRGRVT